MRWPSPKMPIPYERSNKRSTHMSLAVAFHFNDLFMLSEANVIFVSRARFRATKTREPQICSTTYARIKNTANHEI